MNSARIREKNREENVDVVINADEAFLLFHPFCEKFIAPTGINVLVVQSRLTMKNGEQP
jgi:hypothetical protein